MKSFLYLVLLRYLFKIYILIGLILLVAFNAWCNYTDHYWFQILLLIFL